MEDLPVTPTIVLKGAAKVSHEHKAKISPSIEMGKSDEEDFSVGGCTASSSSTIQRSCCCGQ